MSYPLSLGAAGPVEPRNSQGTRFGNLQLQSKTLGPACLHRAFNCEKRKKKAGGHCLDNSFQVVFPRGRRNNFCKSFAATKIPHLLYVFFFLPSKKSFFFFKDFIYLFMRDTDRGRSRFHAGSPMWDLILDPGIMP